MGKSVVLVNEGKDFGLLMLESGMAEVYKRGTFSRKEAYQAAAKAAAYEELGS